MQTKWIFHLLVILSLLLAALPAPAASAVPAASAAPADLLQFSSGGHALGFSASGMYAATGSHALHVSFLGANSVRPKADSSANAVGATAFLSQVTYPDLWDGISLAYTTEAGSIYTTSYTLAPGADPADIHLRYNAPLSLNEDGTLGIAFATGSMTESAPLAWQEIQGERVPVEAAFRVRSQEVGFTLGAYDPGYALTIDPSLYWNTFLGGASDDLAFGITVDGGGNIYVTGESNTTWGLPVRDYTSNYDAFVAKLDSSGALTWNTFLGGNGYERGYGITVDGGGNVYVTGYSNSGWGSPKRAFTANYDAFAVKLNSSGGLTWNTFLGGSGHDEGRGIVVDGTGNILVVGFSTASWDVPLRAYSGGYDAFGAKLKPTGDFSGNTFLGGAGDDYGDGVTMDGNNNIYLTGYSSAAWGCTTPCTARAYTGNLDAFAAKLDGSNGALTWNTFLGGSGYDFGTHIVVDAGGTTLYVAGYSTAAWNCTPSCTTVRAYSAGYDTFAAKLNATTGALTWNTFLGGSGTDESFGIAVDGVGNIYVSGTSSATWGGPLHTFGGGSNDVFAAKLSSSGALTWSTFQGGSGIDCSYGIAVNAGGNVFLTGGSTAIWGSPVQAYTGGDDALVVKLNTSGTLAWNTFLGTGGSDVGNSIALDGSGNIYVTGNSSAYWGSPVQAPAGGADAFVAKLDSSGSLAWNTFLGGSGTDHAHGIAADGNGNVYVVGESSATWGGPLIAYAGGSHDAFAAKLNASTGALTWNTFLGSGSADYGNSIAADTSGNLYVTGYSDANWGNPKRAFTGVKDAFAAKLNASTGALTWNTFLGGGGEDYGKSITVDTSGNLYVTGESTAAWSCTAACTVQSYTAGWDAFLAKLTTFGVLTWNTFLGGSGDDYGNAVAVDGGGNVYVAGSSSDTWGSPIIDYNANSDGFAAKLNASTGVMNWNTFLGGSGYDEGMGIAVDTSGNVYITGCTYGSWGSPVRAYTGLMDASVIKLNSSGVLTLLTFLGGSGYDYGTGIALDGNRRAYVTGFSSATWGSPVHAYTGGEDVLVAKLDLTPPKVVSSLRADANPTDADSVDFTVTFSELVTGVDKWDFKLTVSGITGAAISGVDGSGTTYTVSVSTGTGSGTIRLDVADNDTILDAKSNPLGGKGAGNGNYTGGETYSVRTVCYVLSRTHTGSGSTPVAAPTASSGCPSGQYHAGESITFTASPASGWKVGSWSGTNNNSSTSKTNSLTMPASNRTVKANYILKSIYLPLMLR